MTKYKTSNEWFKDYQESQKIIHVDIWILDYDGWMNGNQNGPCNFMTDLITQEDFTQRLVISTCMWKKIQKSKRITNE